MATFNRHPIDPGTPGETIWQRTKGLLVANESVEVVVISTDDSEGFELRAWTGVRADGSNGPNATPGGNY